MTATGVWRPLSARRAGDEQWHEKVPGALADQLREWIDGAGRELSHSDLERLPVRLHLRFQAPEREDGATASSYFEQLREFLAYRSPDRRVLDVVDAVLDLLPARPPAPVPTDPFGVRLLAAMELAKPAWRQRLQQHLDDARVTYSVADDGHSLVRRTDPATASAVLDAVGAADGTAAAGSASDFLQSGWRALHGLHPDPPKAYSDAIKAVEAAAQAVVQPRRVNATLGTMLGELRGAQHLFKVNIGPNGTDDGAILVAMVELLWKGQTSRHGGQHPTRMETEREARAALHLATTLVAWFAGGAVTRSARP